MKAVQMRRGSVAELGNTSHGVTQPELINESGLLSPSSTRGKPQFPFNVADSWTTKQSWGGEKQREMRQAFPEMLGETVPSHGYLLHSKASWEAEHWAPYGGIKLRGNRL